MDGFGVKAIRIMDYLRTVSLRLQKAAREKVEEVDATCSWPNEHHHMRLGKSGLECSLLMVLLSEEVIAGRFMCFRRRTRSEPHYGPVP